MISGGEFDRDVTISVTTMEQTATGRLAMVKLNIYQFLKYTYKRIKNLKVGSNRYIRQKLKNIVEQDDKRSKDHNKRNTYFNLFTDSITRKSRL